MSLTYLEVHISSLINKMQKTQRIFYFLLVLFPSVWGLELGSCSVCLKHPGWWWGSVCRLRAANTCSGRLGPDVCSGMASRWVSARRHKHSRFDHIQRGPPANSACAIWPCMLSARIVSRLQTPLKFTRALLPLKLLRKEEHLGATNDVVDRKAVKNWDVRETHGRFPRRPRCEVSEPWQLRATIHTRLGSRWCELKEKLSQLNPFWI